MRILKHILYDSSILNQGDAIFMDDIILRLENISKSYRNNVALRSMSVSIQRGEIYGVVGENGAGKSTLIRIIMGLCKPTTGTIELFGNTNPKAVNQQRARIGYIPDVCALYPNMTAEENLEIRCVEWGILKKNIQEILNLVCLSDVGKKVSQYSLGMKQRLSFAIALLGNPEFLVLDEPTNGLDPMGIIELREILVNLNRRKHTTILISSHMLNELHQMATQYKFISHGKLIECISSEKLSKKCSRHLLLQVTDIEKTIVLLEQVLHTENYELCPNNSIRLYAYIDQPDKVSLLLNQNGVGIKQLSSEGDDLETYYMRLIRSEV